MRSQSAHTRIKNLEALRLILIIIAVVLVIIAISIRTTSDNTSQNKSFQQSFETKANTNDMSKHAQDTPVTPKPVNTVPPVETSKRLDLLPISKNASCTSDAGMWSVSDSFGNRYDKWFRFCSCEDYTGYYSGEAIVYTYGEWKYLRGRYFAREDQAPNAQISMQIYADNNLIYDSGMITKYNRPVDFDLNIGNASQIRIVANSDIQTGWMNTSPGIILTNAEVHN